MTKDEEQQLFLEKTMRQNFIMADVIKKLDDRKLEDIYEDEYINMERRLIESMEKKFEELYNVSSTTRQISGQILGKTV